MPLLSSANLFFPSRGIRVFPNSFTGCLPMHHFSLCRFRVFFVREEVDLGGCRTPQHGTPTYVYSAQDDHGTTTAGSRPA